MSILEAEGQLTMFIPFFSKTTAHILWLQGAQGAPMPESVLGYFAVHTFG